MDFEDKKIWQQACGDTDRNYSKTCIKWSVILNGPGYGGSYPECLKHIGSSRKRTDLSRFSSQIKEGDIIVLRLGTKKVFGVGEVVGEYEWSESFSDVDGWDLQHVRRVRWFWHDLEKPKRFSTYDLKQGDTTQILKKGSVRDWVLSLKKQYETVDYQLPKIPEHGCIIGQEEISEHLFEQGISSNSIETLSREFDEIRRIAKWYRGKDAPSEFETVAYLVVPLLRALGWTPQRMAIEWCKVDLALFDQLPREDQNLAVVVEAKKKDNSCLTAQSQAQRYADGKHKCLRLIVTDGLRYGVYVKDEETYILKAYFNLTELREAYPIYDCGGVKQALTMMTPEWRY
tara:strand:+ start:106556 stop:107587 length:1032 start_codon:yes stop_codon:yes gene_type:complete